MNMEKWCTQCECMRPLCDFNLKYDKPRPECRIHGYEKVAKPYIPLHRPQDEPSPFNDWRYPVEPAQLRWAA